MARTKEEIRNKIRELEWKYLHTMSCKVQLRLVGKIEALKWVLGEED